MAEKAELFWLSATEGAVPEHSTWLSAEEHRILAGLRFDKRRRDWRLGRWTAKQLLVHLPECPEVPLHDLEILAAADGAPDGWLRGTRLPVSLSISHREGRAVAAMTRHGRVGCDLEVIEPRTPAFVSDYFTEAELAAVRAAPSIESDSLIALIWSAKESVLKVLREGLRLDTRALQVRHSGSLEDRAAGRLDVAYPAAERVFHGRYSVTGRWMLTLLSDRPEGRPVALGAPTLTQLHD